MAKTETKKRKDEKRKRKEANMVKPKYASLEFESQTTYEDSDSEEANSDLWNPNSYTTWTIPQGFKVTEKFDYGKEPLSFEPVPLATYFMVYAIWSTGDSFGHYEASSCECLGIYQTFEAAQKEMKKLEKKEDHSVPWTGYFNDLNSLEIAEVMCLL